MSTYNVGKGSQQIRLAVDIDTIGLAASRAIVVDLNSTDPAVPVAHSDNATGDIAQKQIGKPKALKAKRLSVLTKIDLIGSEDERKKESERISAKYILDDGKDGHVVFDDGVKVVADDFTTVILFKQVDLTA
ncbi:MAG: hypothetical protein ABI685_14260 [Ferruginibacter sp.]